MFATANDIVAGAIADSTNIMVTKSTDPGSMFSTSLFWERSQTNALQRVVEYDSFFCDIEKYPQICLYYNLDKIDSTWRKIAAVDE